MITVLKGMEACSPASGICAQKDMLTHPSLSAKLAADDTCISIFSFSELIKTMFAVKVASLPLNSCNPLVQANY